MSADRETGVQKIILVVDDEPIILRLASSVLGTAGYRTLVAQNGVAGLELFLRHQFEIALVITDVVMPEGGGMEMVKNIVSANPAAKILVMSGYSDHLVEAQARGRYPFIRKPFLRDDLLRKVRDLLGP